MSRRGSGLISNAACFPEREFQGEEQRFVARLRSLGELRETLWDKVRECRIACAMAVEAARSDRATRWAASVAAFRTVARPSNYNRVEPACVKRGNWKYADKS